VKINGKSPIKVFDFQKNLEIKGRTSTIFGNILGFKFFFLAASAKLETFGGI
jgi:hypothetical protein